jgi:diadenosine tetraphosphatase ApaH/serine/threonine PP2A family protein phosphatase
VPAPTTSSTSSAPSLRSTSAATTTASAALTPANLEWLREVPSGPLHPKHPTNPEQADVTCAHGSPLNEDHYILNMRDAWAPLQQMTTAITFFGHTHVQGGFYQKDHDWHEIKPRYASRDDAQSWTLEIPPGTRHLINPGSIGQPRDCDWRAAYAIYDSEASQIIYHRVPYDLIAAQGRILMAGLPERLAARLREGR